MKRILVSLFIFISILTNVYQSHALNPYGFEQIVHIGNVYARSIVYDEDTGLPLWATYNEDGGHTKISDVDLALAYEGRVISGDNYRAYTQAYEDFKLQYEGKVDLLTTEEFKEQAGDGILTTKDGQPIQNWNAAGLNKDVLSVAIPSKEKRLQFDANQIEKLYFPVNLKELPSVGENIKSVLIDIEGKELKKSSDRIGKLSAFYVEEGGEVEDAAEYEYSSSIKRLHNYDILDPVSGVLIEGVTGYLNGATTSNESGSYRLLTRPSPCPGFMYQPELTATARLYYANFNPKGSPAIPYYLDKRSYNSCNGMYMFLAGIPDLGAQMAALQILAIVTAAPENITTLNYPIAINVLAGNAALLGAAISDTEPTAYDAEESPMTETIVYKDYDGDNIIDGAVRGDFDDDGIFTASEDSENYGVYLSASLKVDGQPNFTRVMDTLQDVKHKGLVKTINKDDLMKTDILVFRESTGQLITERSGLSEEDLGRSKVIGRLQQDENGDFSYTIAIRSTEDSAATRRTWLNTGSWQNWQALNQMNPELHDHQSDFLRNGEQLRIIAINRATGYIGTVITELTGPKDGGDVTVPVPPIIMGPPNLKVWATRTYEPEGLLGSDDERRNTISNEGAATTDDFLIEIHTKWLDANGLPLPAGLEDRGYTGRLVKVSTDPANTSDPYNTQASEFPIDPGTQLQVVKFGEGESEKYHYYLQVNGMTGAEQNDFSTGNHSGVLRHRPNNYVPVLVPLYNENATNINIMAHRQHEEETGEDVDFRDLESSFDWVYRPELSFSVVDLEIESMVRVIDDEESGNILEDDTPIISSSDDSIKFLFDLLTSQFDRITPLDGEQTYILALGEEEVAIEITEGKNSEREISFVNIDHLASLSVEDFLTARLYLNQDSNNALWEFAFEVVVLTPNPEGVDEIIVSADDNEVWFNALYLGYESRDAVDKDIKYVSWKSEGYIGTFSPPVESAQEGSFSSKLTTSRLAGTEGRMYAQTDASGGNGKIYGPNIKVIAGKPATIMTTISGSTAVGGIDEITLDITVNDQFSQPVEDGTSVAISYLANLNVEYDGVTVGGKVKAKVIGASQAGAIDLVIEAGDISKTEQVEVDDVTLSIIMPSSLMPRSKSTVTVSATSPGHDLSGKTVTLRTSKGTLEHYEIPVGGGAAQTTLAAGSVQGSGLLTATLEDLVFQEQAFSIEYTSVLAGLKEPVLVADQNSNGSVPVDKGDGTTFEAPYVVSTEMTLSGTIGNTEKVSIGSLENPPIEPLLYYSLNHVYDDNVVGDAYGVINAVNENTLRNPESSDGFKGSYAFNEGAKLLVPQHSALQKNTNIGFGLKVKPVSPGTIVSYGATSQKLSMTADKRFQYQVTTTDGIYTVESEVVSLSSWHDVGVRYQNGELALEVSGEKYTTAATGNLITDSDISSAVVLGGSFSGLMNNFKVIDWDYPLLATLPNGKMEMDVTFSDATELITISSTNKMGTRTMGYLAANTLGTAFPYAYANDARNSFMGEVTFQAQAVSYALVETAKWSVDASIGFSNGLIYGDTDSTAAIIGDISLGLIPLGDARDVALQNWYKSHKTLNPDGSLKYDETTLYLAYIGLGADGLQFTPAAALGVALNVAAATMKPVMKAIHGLPAKKVLAKQFKVMAEAARDRNWSRLEASATYMLPVMELFAVIAVDAELRTLLATAIRNTTDLDNWAKYLTGFAGQTSEVAHLSPLPESMFDEAYATSGFKSTLKTLLDYAKNKEIDDFGSVLADSIASLRKSLDNNDNFANYIYKEEAIEAIINVQKHLKDAAVIQLRSFGHVGLGLSESESLKRIDDMMLALKELDMAKLKRADIDGWGLEDVMKNISHPTPGFAKGAAFQLIAINKAQKAGKVISGIEAKKVIEINGKELRSRRYDYIEKIGGKFTNVECKAWLPENVARRVKGSLEGTTENGAQLMVDLLDWNRKGFQGNRWEFDSEEAVAIFKSTVTSELSSNSKVRAVMAGHLKINVDDFNDEFLIDVISGLEDFVKVVN